MSEMNSILLNPKDNVVTALKELGIGESIAAEGLTAKIQTMEKIPRGHKIAVAYIPLQAQVVKYGYIIGVTTSDIQRGQLVHVHNIKSCRGKGIGGNFHA